MYILSEFIKLLFVQFFSGPGIYQVVKCGASGHNIRSRPSLKASAVGMLVLGNTVCALEDVSICYICLLSINVFQYFFLTFYH